MTDPFTGPEWDALVKSVETDLIPKLTGSACVVSLVPGSLESDVKFALEIGFSVMMDKPLMAVVSPGVNPSVKMMLIADRIVEIDWTRPDVHERLALEIQRFMQDFVRPENPGG